MATIRQRATNWQCIVKRKGYPPQARTFVLRKDAEKWARQLERQIDTGEWQDRTAAEQTTLGELLDRYQREVSSIKRGHVAERYRINHFKRSSLAKHSPASISSQLIAKWRDDRLKEVQPATVLRELLTLSHVFTVAIQEWGIALHCNPVSLVRKPRAGKPRDRVLTDNQRKSLIISCGECSNQWIKPVVIFALETAARRGEIISLTWNNVDLQRGIATVSGKTGPRKIPLSRPCIELLRGFQASPNGLVFPVSTEALKQAYERAVRRAGIEDFTFHDLRHDALTRLAKMGFNVLELRAISGHATANMLQRYVSINPEDLANKMSNTLEK